MGKSLMKFNEQRVEEIARRYCELCGDDPDERVGHGVEGSGMWHVSPRWTLVAQRVRDEMTMEAAMWDSPQKPKEE